MKFNCDKLSFAIRWCAKMKKINHLGLAELDNYYLSACDGRVTVASTNLLNNIRITYDVDSQETFKVAINRKVKFDGEWVDITTDDVKTKYEFDSGLKLIMSAQLFTEMNLFDEIISPSLFSTDQSFFTEMIDMKNYTTSDEMRPAMTGVNLKTKESKTLMTASDGHALKTVFLDGTHWKEFDIVLQHKLIELLSAFRNIKSEIVVSEYLQTWSKDKMIVIAFEWSGFKFSIVSRLIGQAYPDFQAVIPTEQQNALMFKKTNLLAALRSLLPWTNQVTHQVNIRVMEKTLYSNDYDYMNEFEIPVWMERKGDFVRSQTDNVKLANAAAFNAKFLIRCINSCKDEDIEFQYATPNKPFVMKTEKQIVLIMPVIIY